MQTNEDMVKAKEPDGGDLLNDQNQSAQKATEQPKQAAPLAPVTGNGTVGQIPKWIDTSIIEDSTITEDSAGNIGIGTTTPGSKLTVAGTIETTQGYRFPDGSVQTSAAPFPIIHQPTLTGDGTRTNPLAVSVPLFLAGTAPRPVAPLLEVKSLDKGNVAVVARGGFNLTGPGGEGIRAHGGFSKTDLAGRAVFAAGGESETGPGGAGVDAIGGASNGTRSNGGVGVAAIGGAGNLAGGTGGRFRGGFARNFAGYGVEAYGGGSPTSGVSGGIGLFAFGGESGPGIFGGSGILAFGGGTRPFQGPAAQLIGDLNVVGGTKRFQIDHPLAPADKYLYHAAIESSEVLNVYSGNITTDADGVAAVQLPDWFEAINRDFRYQLTVIGSFAQAMVAEEIKGNRFSIKTNAPNVKVSWQVTGVRSDAAMLKQPFRPEEDKPKAERGYYLDPAAFDQPDEKGVHWARNPELMSRVKQERENLGK